MEKEISIKDKLEQIKKDIAVPVKLSDNEKEQIRKAFQAIRSMLEGSETSVLDMDRDEAYRYVNLIIIGLQQADVNFIGGQKSKEPLINSNGEPVKKVRGEPALRPNYEGLLEQLEPEERKKAEYLECFTSFKESGIEAICPECTSEKMKTCIKTYDPSITIRNLEDGPSRVET